MLYNLIYLYKNNREKILVTLLIITAMSITTLYVSSMYQKSKEFEATQEIVKNNEVTKVARMNNKIEEQTKLLVEYDTKIKELEEQNRLLQLKYETSKKNLSEDLVNRDKVINELETEMGKNKITIEKLNEYLKEQGNTINELRTAIDNNRSTNSELSGLVDMSNTTYIERYDNYNGKPIGGVNWKDVRQISGLSGSELEALMGDSNLRIYAEHFAKAEAIYGVNSLFLLGLAKHESNDGQSRIFKDKNNMFGYGAYDATPYESAVDFEKPEYGIYTVAKYLSENYLSDDGKHFNGYSIKDINKKYASDKEWNKKIKKIVGDMINKYNSSV